MDKFFALRIVTTLGKDEADEVKALRTRVELVFKIHILEQDCVEAVIMGFDKAMA